MNFKSFKRYRKIFGKLAIKYEDKIIDKADDINFYRSLLEEENSERANKEYLLMRERAQYDGCFAVVSFDMKDSKKGYNYDVLKLLFDEYVNTLKSYEEKWGTKILHEPAEKSLPLTNDYFQLGDLFSFPIEYSDDLDINFFTHVFKKVKSKLGVEYQFHFIMLRYETDYYFEGGNKYYLMDAVKDSESLAKEKEDLI